VTADTGPVAPEDEADDGAAPDEAFLEILSAQEPGPGTGVHEGTARRVTRTTLVRIRQRQPPPSAVSRATSAVRNGDLRAALAALEPVLGDPDHRDAAAATELAAIVLAQAGHPDRAGQLFHSLDPAQVGSGWPTAAFVLMASGAQAKAATIVTDQRPDSTIAGGIRALTALGLRQSLDNDVGTATSTLLRAAAMTESADPPPVMADTAAAVAALLAIHVGDLDVAESTLRRAIGRDREGDVSSYRHRLLLAWVAMMRGRFTWSHRLVGEIGAQLDDRVDGTLRDELWLAALRVGLARRTSDAAGLVAAWSAGRDVLLRSSVDLFSLLPLGEFAVAAVRVREYERVGAHLAAANRLLCDLGEPVAWSPPLRWYLVQTGIMRNRPIEVKPHAAALVRAARSSPYAAALAAGGRTWLRVLAGEVLPAKVETVARGLQSFGLAWDGSRLLGQAAAQSKSRQDVAALLQAARSLQHPDGADDPDATPTTAAVAPLLSGREREIAALLVQQHTYREIGTRLFISPKTVEHHVARIKQRVGAVDRAELIARLRAL